MRQFMEAGADGIFHDNWGGHYAPSCWGPERGQHEHLVTMEDKRLEAWTAANRLLERIKRMMLQYGDKALQVNSNVPWGVPLGARPLALHRRRAV